MDERARVRFECRSLGNACEWALAARTTEEVLERVRDHMRCAHAQPELPADLASQVRASVRSG